MSVGDYSPNCPCSRCEEFRRTHEREVGKSAYLAAPYGRSPGLRYHNDMYADAYVDLAKQSQIFQQNLYEHYAMTKVPPPVLTKEEVVNYGLNMGATTQEKTMTTPTTEKPIENVAIKLLAEKLKAVTGLRVSTQNSLSSYEGYVTQYEAQIAKHDKEIKELTAALKKLGHKPA